jgi:hypothetical protein
MSGLRTLYTDSNTFMDMLLECSRFIDSAALDQTCTKEDVLASMENRVSLLIGKLASHPASSTFTIDLSGD